MKYLHKKNIIHRDIKAENLLIDSDGVLKLTGFAYVVQLDDMDGRVNQYCGTPNYMAPEIARGDEGGYGLAVDIWSFGAVM